MAACHTCELVRRRDGGDAPPWDSIDRTAGWDVVHAFGTDVEGWTVLVVRRHIATIAELIDDEATELGPLIKRVSEALHATVGCEKTYVAQFADHPDHRHVHVHVIPRPHELPHEQRGPRIFSRLGLSADRCVPEDRMDEIAAGIRRHLRSVADS